MTCFLRNASSLCRQTVSTVKGRRCLQLSAVRKDIFTVQDEEDFKNKVANSKVPVVVDFFATWCGPCKILTPRLETIIAEKKDAVNLAKIDVDANESIAMKFQVSSVPSVFAMKGGKVVDQFVGTKDDDQLRAFVDKLA